LDESFSRQPLWLCSAPHAIFSPPENLGAKLRNLFFSFSGRLGRLGFLFRGMALGITTGVLLVIGFTMFVHGALWWLGLLIAVIALAVLVVGRPAHLGRDRAFDEGLPRQRRTLRRRATRERSGAGRELASAIIGILVARGDLAIRANRYQSSR